MTVSRDALAKGKCKYVSREETCGRVERLVMLKVGDYVANVRVPGRFTGRIQLYHIIRGGSSGEGGGGRRSGEKSLKVK